MKAIPYSVTLLENVLIGDPSAEDPNTTGGLNYIPGSIIRGAVIQYLKANKQKEFKSEVYPICMNGNVKFLNAYPGAGKKERTRPAPLFLKNIKDNEADVINTVLYTDEDIPEQLERFRKPFLYYKSGTCLGYEPDMQLRLHNARSEGSGPNGEDAQLFTYSSLAAGQVFRGYLISENGPNLEFLKNSFPSEDWETDIGKSKYAEYGHVQIHFDHIEENWREIEEKGSSRTEGKLVVVLLSDVILRDQKTGSFALSLAPIVGEEHDRAFTRQKIIGGYNRYWKLPLPQCQAISAGSTFVYPNSSTLCEKIKLLVENGVGERTIDGFGRIALEVMDAKKYTYQTEDQEKSDILSINQPGHSPTELAKNVVERIFLQRVRSKLPQIARKTPTKNFPSNTQLARLERVLRKEKDNLLTSPDKQWAFINEFIHNLTKETKLKYDNAYINKWKMLDWLKKKLDDPDTIWENLDVEIPDISGMDIDKKVYSKLFVVEYVSLILKLERKKRKLENKKREVNHG